jgi:hypothetical protein
LATYWNRRDGGLWIISLEPYSETFVLAGIVDPFGWSADGKYVYAVRQGEIIRVRATAANEFISLAALPSGIAHNRFDAGVSPDGRQIIVDVEEEKSDVWFMENFDPSASRARTQSN